MIAFPKRYTSSPLGHSADIELWLHTNGRKIPLRQTCGTCVKLEHDQRIVPGRAKVEVIVDRVSHCTEVTITAKRPDSLWVDIEMVKNAANQSAA